MIYSVNLSLKKLPLCLSGAMMILFLAVNLSAQITDRINISDIRNDVRFTEWQLKNFGQSRQSSSSAAVEPIAWRQVREDFLQLQIAGNDLRKFASSGTSALDYRLLKDAASQIKKRAARLKRNLPLPASDNTSEDLKTDAHSFEEAVKLLDEAVMRFTGNPVFKQTQLIDASGGAAQAGRDLRLVITLSENLKKLISGLATKTRQ